MVGVPEALPGAAADAPVETGFQTRGATQAFELPLGLQTIDRADGANPAIAFQYFFTQVAGIGSQPPFLHAPSRTERNAASFRNFQIAPAAKMTSIGTSRKALAAGPAAGMLRWVLMGSSNRLIYFIGDVYFRRTCL